MTSEPRTYTCDNCGGTFEAEWTEEEARAEAAANFTAAEIEDPAQVCDDCYKKMMAWHDEQVTN